MDQDFIPRRITSAVVVFEGVSTPKEARKTIMWTALGYPACAVAVPLVLDKWHVPHYMLARDEHAQEGDGLHSEMCDLSLQIKDQWVLPLRISNGKRYVNIQHILRGTDIAPSLLNCTQRVEKAIEASFSFSAAITSIDLMKSAITLSISFSALEEISSDIFFSIVSAMEEWTNE